MNRRDLQRLREEQQLAISQTEEKIHALNKYRSDYVSLQEKLETLPDKISHHVMVPFGKKAFIPGQLIHTNEILVLLGDNWFADRSAKQSSEIVDRRLIVLDKQITELKDQLGLLTPRLDFTSELHSIAQEKGDVVEISEEYDAEREKSWRERHRESVRKYNAEVREEQAQAVEREERKARERGRSEAELWARLDELELQEQHADELHQSEASESDSSRSGEEESCSESEEDSDRKIRWKDETQPMRTTPASVIRFSHTPRKSQNADAMQGASASDQMVTTPADIYKQFSVHGPKSILKQTVATSDQRLPRARKETEETESQHVVKEKVIPEHAFSRTVVEKKTEKIIMTTAKDRTDSDLVDSQTQPVDSQTQPKKVSRFKARRMQPKE